MTGDQKTGWKTSENINSWGAFALLGTLSQTAEDPRVSAAAVIGMSFVMGCYALSRGMKKKAQ